jgi:NADH:ubiquinone oxidoreductase subunit 6 (subunit J)
MESKQKSLQLAQSASALGAGILGLGLGAKWGKVMTNYALLIIIVGAIIHVFGMYIMQMKNTNGKATGIAKALWISAWICLIALVAIIIYLLIYRK